MPTIEIYFNDLTKEKQKEILNKCGENGNYDVMPISTIEFENNECSREKKLFYIKHSQAFVGHFAVRAENETDAYDVFLRAANDGRVDYSNLYLSDSENEIVSELDDSDDAVLIEDEDDETEKCQQSM